MAKCLVVIESPNKIKTIQKYLGTNYEIIATVGHIRDIPQFGNNAFNQQTYEPTWRIITKPQNKKKVIEEIKNKAKHASKIYLATDPDREGEAIAWHVYDVLDNEAKNKTVRITFNEITKPAIELAIKHERKIAMEWVHSQFARRILDRVIGYDLSKFVHKKFSGSSAGRVQSVVLKFIYEREQEIAKFQPRSWYTIDVKLANDDFLILREIPCQDKDAVIVNNEEQGSGIDFNTELAANKIKNTLKKEFQVYLIDPPKILKRKQPDPYKTSTLQQDAINKLNWSLAKITKIIQDLYEGINIDNEQVALITYPRTDSIRMADSFKLQAKKFIETSFGSEYVATQTQKIIAKAKNVQDAHECIRVIDPFLLPSKIKGKVNDDYFKMYDLIWKRSIASLMSPLIMELITVRLANNGCKFYTYTRQTIFMGFKKVYQNNENEKIDSKAKYKVGQIINAATISTNKHTTVPPARFNQASLVKILDETGVGRPSTYKMMVDIGLNRGYCELQNRAYHLTNIGKLVIEGLIKYFGDVIDKKFTRDMEERLDIIAEKKEEWNSWLISFVPKFKQKVQKINQSLTPKLLETGRICPNCGKKLVYRFSKITKKQFIGCEGFPNCKYAEFPGNKELNVNCPLCGHKLVEKTSKYGKKFIGCSQYPNCKFIVNSLNEIKIADNNNIEIKNK